jgi:hypothetical protein
MQIAAPVASSRHVVSAQVDGPPGGGTIVAVQFSCLD